jgi:tRNA(Ile)-lysidine synthase
MLEKTIKKIDQFIAAHRLILDRKRYLLAVSGGIDSMVLATYFVHKKIDVAIAHINFKLRGEESDGDELLVKSFADKHAIPFYRTEFQTEKYATDRHLSIQMAARELRYQWLEAIRNECSCEAIITAHHSNDNIETILLNWTRGAGISGLRGILPKRNNIIRPLLVISKQEVFALASFWKVDYRDDSSNASVKYQRNLIRHQIIPLLKEINPAIEQTITQHADYLKDAESIYQSFIAKKLQKLIQVSGQLQKAPMKAFLNHQYGKSLLFEWLSPCGFNSAQLVDVTAALKKEQSGLRFFSPSHEISCDRTYIFLLPKNTGSDVIHPILPTLMLNASVGSILLNKKVVHYSIENELPTSYDATNKVVYLDANKVQFPILIRNWQQGDYMYPLGMKMKKKKLSDLFSNHKIPNYLKQELLVFEAANKIIFVEGIRVDERFKVKESTTVTLKISIEEMTKE